MTDPQELVDAALAASTADGCVVVAAEHSETNLRWAANSLTTNGQMRSRSLTVICTVDPGSGTRAGVVTRSVSTVDEVADLVRAAEASARAADPAEDVAPLVGPGDSDAGSDVAWDSDPDTTDVTVFDEFAPALGAAFARWRSAGLSLFGFAEHQVTSYFLGSSTGLRRRFDQPDGRLEINGKSADLTRSAWDGHYSRDFTGIDVAAVADRLEQRLDWARTRLDQPAGRYETLLPPTAVADLMIYAYWTAARRDAEEGRNVFAGADGGTRIGEQLTQVPLTLRSDPAAPGLQCAPFEIATSSDGSTQSVFDNGLPVPAASWIADGRLTDLASTRAVAARSGSPSRPLVGNLLMSADGASASLDQMIASTERGLLLTCLWYIREVDPQTLLLTGLTRDGVYLVEDGAVRGAVNNFRFNESPVDLLGRITEVGCAEHTLPREWGDYFMRASMPPVRVADFNMSTVSPAS